jgi:hypothetical protein
MRFSVLAMTVLATLMIAISRPASASISAATISTGQPSYAGACPHSMTFTGTITGTPGTVFTYSLNRFVNSVQQVVSGATLTMPSGGSVAVSDAISVSTSTSGNTFDQIWVHNISGGQGDQYSNKANFTVSCGAPPSPSSPISHSLIGSTVLQTFFVTAPTGMGITHDTPTCSAHGGFGGGLACTAGLQAGMLALVWNCAGCKADGYHLYRVDGGQHTLLSAGGAYASDASVTLALLSPPSDGFNGKCYAVTAYKGPNESALSNWTCAGAGSVATTTTLYPTQALHWHHDRQSRTGTLGHTDAPADRYDATLYVGYADHYGENPFGDFYYDQFNRSGVLFDLSSLAGHPINKAILKLSAFASWHDYDSTDYVKLMTANLSAQSPSACVSIVDLATDHWWQNNDLANSVSFVAPGEIMGPDFTIDVTNAVAKWTGPAAPPNYGFVLRGDDENDTWHGNTNHVCLTQLQSVSLLVTYY